MLWTLLSCLISAVFFGLSIWLLANLAARRPANRAGREPQGHAATRLNRRPPPEPYHVRLARYLRVAPEELPRSQVPGESRMPLWISPLVVLERHSPKTRELIRYFLERIRRTVRGTAAGFRTGPRGPRCS